MAGNTSEKILVGIGLATLLGGVLAWGLPLYETKSQHDMDIAAIHSDIHSILCVVDSSTEDCVRFHPKR